jgi:hypothetical protein
MGVVVDDIVTTVELINCKKVQVQAKNVAGSWIVDKCDRTTIYLPEASVKDKVRPPPPPLIAAPPTNGIG